MQQRIAREHRTYHWPVEVHFAKPRCLQRIPSRIRTTQMAYSGRVSSLRETRSPSVFCEYLSLAVRGDAMSRTRILLVDDDEVVRLMMNEVLQQEGLDVTTSSSVTEALKLISSNVYDVLLSDLHMPG